MSFTRDTARVSAQTAIYDILRGGVLYVALVWVWPWLTARAAAMNIPGAVAWSGLVLVVAIFVGVFLFDWYRADKKLKPKPLQLPEVAIFTHDSAIKSNPLLPGRIEQAFRDAGWSVALRRTSLERHRDGVWVLGGSGAERKVVSWGLRSLGIEPREDDADTQPDPQIVVGQYAVRNDRHAEFYENRHALTVARPLVATITSAQTVWALWNAGSTAWAQNAHKLNRIQRLLLPNPKSRSLEAYAPSVDRSRRDIANGILGFTREAIRAGVAVKWFDDAPGNTITIGNPAEPNGWIQIEAAFVGAGINERPIVWIDKAQFPTAFRNILNSFDAVWRDAQDPVPDTNHDWERELAIELLNPVGDDVAQSKKLSALTSELHERTTERDELQAKMKSTELQLRTLGNSVNVLDMELRSERQKFARVQLEHLGRTLPPLTVKVRFLEFVDASLADHIKSLLHDTTQWKAETVRDDGSTTRRRGSNRIEVKSGKPEHASFLAGLLNHGLLLGERVDPIEEIDSADENIIVTIFPRSSMPQS